MNKEICFLCYTPGQPDVPAVKMSPYGYSVCMSHYRSDFSEFVSDYSWQVLDIPLEMGPVRSGRLWITFYNATISLSDPSVRMKT